MRVKKQIALLLSGAVLTGSLAGCAQTAVDHHFFTETQTDIQYIMDLGGLADIASADPQVTQSLCRLDKLVKTFNIEIGWSITLVCTEIDKESIENEFGSFNQSNADFKAIMKEVFSTMENSKKANSSKEWINRYSFDEVGLDGFFSKYAECINDLCVGIEENKDKFIYYQENNGEFHVGLEIYGFSNINGEQGGIIFAGEFKVNS